MYKHLNMPKDGFVFIVTYGRSGSTLLQNLINSIDGYQIRGENNNMLFHMARAWMAVNGSEEMRGMRFSGKTSDQTHPWFGAECVDPDALGAQLANTFTRAILQPAKNTRVSGFKEIRFHTNKAYFDRFLNFIHQFFPKSRFIFNTRDHDAVAKSGWWAKQDPAHVKQVLGEAESLFDAYAKQYPDRVYQLHYDEYVGRPDKLRPLFKFLGEPFDRDMVETVMATRLDHLRIQAVEENQDTG
jgi:sulfotransferase family protein